MAKQKSKRLDVNQIAASMIERTTQAKIVAPPPPREKSEAAVALGRLGGLKGGKARAERLSKRRRAEIACKAAKSRWAVKR